jgi:hypothetical protein
MVLKSIGVFSLGKVWGFFYALIGLIVGALFTLYALASAGSGRPGIREGEVILGMGAVIIFPIVYGLIGLIAGIISAALYNVVAATVGGVEFELARDTNE